jgi:hypothetical protein
MNHWHKCPETDCQRPLYQCTRDGCAGKPVFCCEPCEKEILMGPQRLRPHYWVPHSPQALAKRAKIAAIIQRVREGVIQEEIASEFDVTRQYVSFVSCRLGLRRERGRKKLEGML